MGSRVAQAPCVNPTSLLWGSPKKGSTKGKKQWNKDGWQGGHKDQARAPGPKYVGKDRNQEKASGHSGFCQCLGWLG